jgi:hypothetical protein
MALHLRNIAAFNIRRPSLLRANVLVLGSMVAAFLISGFTPTVPLIRATYWQLLPMFGGIAGMAETARCIRPKWGMYHAAVVLFLFTDLMVITLLALLLVYPFWSQ